MGIWEAWASGTLGLELVGIWKAGPQGLWGWSWWVYGGRNWSGGVWSLVEEVEEVEVEMEVEKEELEWRSGSGGVWSLVRSWRSLGLSWRWRSWSGGVWSLVEEEEEEEEEEKEEKEEEDGF